MNKKIWYDCFWFLIRNVYFRKIEFSGNKDLLSGRPSLFLSLHKNGAVDGWPILSVVPETETMMAAQLSKNFFVRLFFYGIPVVRDKDKGNKRMNIKAFAECVKRLKKGKNLLIFPEGTSTLGPKHLEFKKGAAKIIKKYAQENGKELSVIPLGIYYDSPTKMGGKVEITAGQKIDISSNDTETIHKNITLALEKEGVNVESEKEYAYMEQFAVIASLYGDVRYSKAIKAAEKDHQITDKTKKYAAETEKLGLIKYKEVAVFPQNVFKSFLTFCITAPLVLVAFAFNLIPVSIGFFCGKKLPDEKNVITFWRIVTGFAAGLVWIVFVLIFFKLSGALLLLVSFLGFKVYGAFKKHFVSLVNFFKAARVRKEFQQLRQDAVKRVKNCRPEEI